MIVKTCKFVLEAKTVILSASFKLRVMITTVLKQIKTVLLCVTGAWPGFGRGAKNYVFRF